MSEGREPFFTTDEWKALVLFRPREWPDWWRTEPLTTKVLAIIFAALLVYGVYGVVRGDTETGWTLIAIVGLLLVLLTLFPLTRLLFAAGRWALRKSGALAIWRRIRKGVLATVRVVFWAGFVGLILTGLWPYLSLDPVKSWYALTRNVPAERVEVQRKPHDCEFETAPLGSKHCHYDANVFVIKAADSPDGKKSLLVTYEKIED